MLLLALPAAATSTVEKAFWALAAAVVVLLFEMARSQVNTWRENRKKAKQSSFVYLAEKQVVLDVTTERLCMEIKPNHVALYRLHNGQFFEGDDSIKKMSMVSESVNGMGIGRWKAVSQDMLMSDFPHLVLALDGASKQPFCVMQDDNVLDFEMGRLMNVREYTTSIALLVRGKKERPLALLVLSWCSQRRYLQDVDTAVLDSFRRDFSYTLSD